MQILKRIFYNKLRYTHLLAFIKNNSILKLTNFIYSEYECRIKKVKVKSKPYLINSEPTNSCNYKCPFCPTGKREPRSIGFAPVELYESLLKKIGKYTYLITLHGWGEPLMNKHLPEIIKLAHDNKIFTVVTSNGSLLTKEISKEIISSKLDYLILSVDGTSEESYQKYRIGGSLDVVMNNIKELILLKKEMKSKSPFIEMQFIVFKHNEHEISGAKKLAKELEIDNIVFMPAYTEDSGFDSTDKKYHLPKRSPLSERKDCKHLWTTLTFHWNGKVVSCCYDYSGEIEYSDIKNENFDELWNSHYFQESRTLIKTGQGNSDQELYCKSCVRNITIKN